MKNNIFKRSLALFLALICVLGALPLSALAADATPPASITQISSDYVTINGKYVRYRAASDAINSVGLPYVFNEQVNITGETGEINISGLEPGVYSVKETATISDHILDVREYHVELFPSQTSTITIENQKRPNLIVWKRTQTRVNPYPTPYFW